MNNNIRKFMVAGLACAAAFTTTFAAPHGGRPGATTHVGKTGATTRTATPARQQMRAPGNGYKTHAQPVTKTHHAPPTRKFHAQPAPRMHNAAPKMHHAAPARREYARRHTPPPRPVNHRPCGFLHPRGHHIGGLHIAIVPPTVLVDSYYWTEEVFINGVYYILYCYPDGTKRFADGTIYCYV